MTKATLRLAAACFGGPAWAAVAPTKAVNEAAVPEFTKRPVVRQWDRA